MIDVALKITALFSAAWLVSFLLRGRAASTRHAVWTGLMAAALLLPVFGPLAPQVELAWLPADSPRMQQPQPGPQVDPAPVPPRRTPPLRRDRTPLFRSANLRQPARYRRVRR